MKQSDQAKRTSRKRTTAAPRDAFPQNLISIHSLVALLVEVKGTEPDDRHREWTTIRKALLSAVASNALRAEEGRVWSGEAIEYLRERRYLKPRRGPTLSWVTDEIAALPKTNTLLAATTVPIGPQTERAWLGDARPAGMRPQDVHYAQGLEAEIDRLRTRVEKQDREIADLTEELDKARARSKAAFEYGKTGGRGRAK